MTKPTVTDEIAAKVNALQDGFRRELNKACFPEGREAAVEALEETIHQLTFQKGVHSQLPPPKGGSLPVKPKRGCKFPVD